MEKKMEPTRIGVGRWWAAALLVALVTGVGPRVRAVGYVNVPITAGYNYMCNPLYAGVTNGVNELFMVGSDPLGLRIYLWDFASQVFTAPTILTTNGWTTNYSLGVGPGFVLWSPINYTHTFVGEVVPGPGSTNKVFLPGGNKWTFVGSTLPASVLALGDPPVSFPARDGDNVLQWNVGAQRFVTPSTFFAGHGWFNPEGGITTSGPSYTVGTAFFVQRPGPGIFWSQMLPSPPALAGDSLRAGPTQTTPQVTDVRAESGSITLTVSSGGAPYNVQHSTDGVNWSTVAIGQTTPTWTGPMPGGQGFYQVVNQ